MNCRVYRWLFAALPILAWRSLLLRRHLGSCPDCQRELDPEGAIPSILIQWEQVPSLPPLWPADARQGVEPLRRDGFTRLPISTRWAASLVGGFLLAALLLVGRFFRSSSLPGPRGSEAPGQVQLLTAYSRGSTARVYYFQSRNPDRSIFWVAAPKKEGG